LLDQAESGPLGGMAVGSAVGGSDWWGKGDWRGQGKLPDERCVAVGWSWGDVRGWLG